MPAARPARHGLPGAPRQGVRVHAQQLGAHRQRGRGQVHDTRHSVGVPPEQQLHVPHGARGAGRARRAAQDTEQVLLRAVRATPRPAQVRDSITAISPTENCYADANEGWGGCSEQWDGARIGLDGAKERYLADDAYQLTDLSPAMGKLLSGMERVFVLKPDGGRYSPAFVEATQAFHSKFFAGDFLVEQLRVVKSENELNRMRFAADIGAQGFIDMMKNTRPGMTELALGSTFEGSVKKNGALWNAFPNVVGSGSNAAVIHYLSKRDLLRENELVLVDSGCEVAGGYASDITRTWPVGGKLTSGQTTMYEFVLDVQKKCIEHLRKKIETEESITLNELHDYSVEIMMERMLDFGILKNKGGAFSRSAMREFQKYNPTHIGHYLGMDTHDTPHITRGAPLVPGMVVTVEPGIYLPKNDLNLPEELRGIGIRIEDDVVVRAS
ncbi:unnamed protein product [Phytophthora fragariaefolia]|uniref:Unnamed protein product n=1 Tax=Phytophthora fragariaefolia TaxID=1490495 RepID=A0A9W6XPQ6_9STRA|nr:unnamed protein product [Phytophthora fragariaefolia]